MGASESAGARKRPGRPPREPGVSCRQTYITQRQISTAARLAAEASRSMSHLDETARAYAMASRLNGQPRVGRTCAYRCAGHASERIVVT
jgi:hypothetical protein